MKHTHIFATFLACVAAATPSFADSLSLGASSSDGITAEGTRREPSTGEPSTGQSSSGTSGKAKYAPEAGLFEIGLFAGLLHPSIVHNLQAEPSQHRHYSALAPELGLRAAYFPHAAFGVELEGAAMSANVDKGSGAGLWAARGHLIGQLTDSRLTPFALLGVGALGANSQTMGKDADFAVHAGLGVKYAIDDVISARLDLRDTLSQEDQHSTGSIAHHPEALLGISMTLDRSRPKPVVSVPPDGDADGFADAVDQCPQVAGVAPNGCPADSDGDQVIDSQDRCPSAAGPLPDGCPPPPDRDGDKVADSDDDCPEVPGDFKRGCPNPDPDKDGVSAEQDKCPTEPETANGYLDSDGCPDELPAAVKKFSGVMAGIEFELGKATIRPGSRTVLDAAIGSLKEYPELKLLITGHTDNVGKRETNLELSKNRADSVKNYFISKGIEAARLTTRGAGPDEPLSKDDTYAGRQKNRRIEFTLVK